MAQYSIGLNGSTPWLVPSTVNPKSPSALPFDIDGIVYNANNIYTNITGSIALSWVPTNKPQQVKITIDQSILSYTASRTTVHAAWATFLQAMDEQLNNNSIAFSLVQYIVAQVRQNLPMPLSEVLFFYYGSGSGSSYSFVNLVPGMQVRVAPSNYYGNNPAPIGNNYGNTGDTLLRVTSLPGGNGVSLSPYLQNQAVSSNASGNSVNGLASPMSAAAFSGNAYNFYRLYYPKTLTAGGDLDASHMPCITGLSSYHNFTDAPPASSGGGNAQFTGYTAVIPELAVTVNGQKKYVPVGTTIRQLLEQNNMPQSIPNTLTIFKQFGAQMVPLSLASNSSYALDLPVTKGDRIQWLPSGNFGLNERILAMYSMMQQADAGHSPATIAPYHSPHHIPHPSVVPLLRLVMNSYNLPTKNDAGITLPLNMPSMGELANALWRFNMPNHPYNATDIDQAFVATFDTVPNHSRTALVSLNATLTVDALNYVGFTVSEVAVATYQTFFFNPELINNTPSDVSGYHCLIHSDAGYTVQQLAQGMLAVAQKANSDWKKAATPFTYLLIIGRATPGPYSLNDITEGFYAYYQGAMHIGGSLTPSNSNLSPMTRWVRNADQNIEEAYYDAISYGKATMPTDLAIAEAIYHVAEIHGPTPTDVEMANGFAVDWSHPTGDDLKDISTMASVIFHLYDPLETGGIDPTRLIYVLRMVNVNGQTYDLCGIARGVFQLGAIAPIETGYELTPLELAQDISNSGKNYATKLPEPSKTAMLTALYCAFDHLAEAIEGTVLLYTKPVNYTMANAQNDLLTNAATVMSWVVDAPVDFTAETIATGYSTAFTTLYPTLNAVDASISLTFGMVQAQPDRTGDYTLTDVVHQVGNTIKTTYTTQTAMLQQMAWRVEQGMYNNGAGTIDYSALGYAVGNGINAIFGVMIATSGLAQGIYQYYNNYHMATGNTLETMSAANLVVAMRGYVPAATAIGLAASLYEVTNGGGVGSVYSLNLTAQTLYNVTGLPPATAGNHLSALQLGTALYMATIHGVSLPDVGKALLQVQTAGSTPAYTLSEVISALIQIYHQPPLSYANLAAYDLKDQNFLLDGTTLSEADQLNSILQGLAEGYQATFGAVGATPTDQLTVFTEFATIAYTLVNTKAGNDTPKELTLGQSLHTNLNKKAPFSTTNDISATAFIGGLYQVYNTASGGTNPNNTLALAMQSCITAYGIPVSHATDPANYLANANSIVLSTLCVTANTWTLDDIASSYEQAYATLYRPMAITNDFFVGLLSGFISSQNQPGVVNAYTVTQAITTVGKAYQSVVINWEEVHQTNMLYAYEQACYGVHGKVLPNMGALVQGLSTGAGMPIDYSLSNLASFLPLYSEHFDYYTSPTHIWPAQVVINALYTTYGSNGCAEYIVQGLSNAVEGTNDDLCYNGIELGNGLYAANPASCNRNHHVRDGGFYMGMALSYYSNEPEPNQTYLICNWLRNISSPPPPAPFHWPFNYSGLIQYAVVQLFDTTGDPNAYSQFAAQGKAVMGGWHTPAHTPNWGAIAQEVNQGAIQGFQYLHYAYDQQKLNTMVNEIIFNWSGHHMNPPFGS